MARKILHLDLDAFFCAVEEIRQPSLRGIPFAVGGRPEARGVVSSCSYAARQFGVRSAISMRRALQLCPQLQIIPPNHALYRRISQQVMDLLRQLTPLIEQVSIDEAFLDISDLKDDPLEVAKSLQQKINTELGLPCSIGAASNKLVAKIANDVGKARNQGDKPPNAITIVSAGEEAEFLADLPVIALWGVGPKTAERLAGLGIQTIRDLSARSEAELVQKFGKFGHRLYHFARGIDETPIRTTREIKSVSQEITFAHDLADGKKLRQTLQHLAEQLSKRLHAHHLRGKTIKLKLRWANFQTLTRQVSLPQPTDLETEIYTAAEQLFNQNWQPGALVRLIGLGISGFEDRPYQLSLWDEDAEHIQPQQ